MSMPADANRAAPKPDPEPGLPALIACHDCDLLQRASPVAIGSAARCSRCGAVLYRNHRDSLDRSLAYTLAAIVLFVVANSFPVVGLQVGADRVQTTLLGAVQAMWKQHMQVVAVLVFVTTMLTPLLELAALAWLLLPIRLQHRPQQAPRVFRTLHLASEWSMMEVFMLGLLVALVKLAHIAAVVPGVALWSFGALMLLLVAALATFDGAALWARLERLR